MADDFGVFPLHPEAEMAAYIATGEPFDKAGGYGACPGLTLVQSRFH